MSNEQYNSWKALVTAYKERAKQDSSASVDQHLRFARFDRFLSRVFSDEENSEWLLKGGTGLLARVPESRATKDVDLVTTQGELDDAQQALIELAHRDLGDHVEFRFKSSRPTGQGENQPNVQARNVVFECIDASTKQPIDDVQVDLAVEQAPVGRVERMEPQNRLHLPKHVPSHPYRLFPVSDQIADKVWATMQGYGDGRSSSREKDLVDLVVISRTQRVELHELSHALEVERQLRGATAVGSFAIPENWGPRYSKLARQTPACAGLTDAAAATKRVKTLVDPAMTLQPNASSATWSPDAGWEVTGHKTGVRRGNADQDIDQQLLMQRMDPNLSGPGTYGTPGPGY